MQFGASYEMGRGYHLRLPKQSRYPYFASTETGSTIDTGNQVMNRNLLCFFFSPHLCPYASALRYIACLKHTETFKLTTFLYISTSYPVKNPFVLTPFFDLPQLIIITLFLPAELDSSMWHAVSFQTSPALGRVSLIAHDFPGFQICSNLKHGSNDKSYRSHISVCPRLQWV